MYQIPWPQKHIQSGAIYHFSTSWFFTYFRGLPIFKGPEKYTLGVEKVGFRNFCVLWTLKGHKKQHFENEHENQQNDKISLNDLKWPPDDLCGKSWPLITKITISSDSLTPNSYEKWCHLSFLVLSEFLPIFGGADFQGAGKIH